MGYLEVLFQQGLPRLHVPQRGLDVQPLPLLLRNGCSQPKLRESQEVSRPQLLAKQDDEHLLQIGGQQVPRIPKQHHRKLNEQQLVRLHPIPLRFNPNRDLRLTAQG